MAVLNFVGFETGNTSEVDSTSGATISSSTVRTGGYALRLQNTGAECRIPRISTSTLTHNVGATGGLYNTFYFRYAAQEAGTRARIARVTKDSDGTDNSYISISDNVLRISVGATSADGSTTLSANTWYKIDYVSPVGASATVSVYVNGVLECQVTAATTTNSALWLGGNSTGTFDFFYDDVVCASNSLYSGNPAVLRSVPIGAGASSDWTDGTGSTYAEVDEVPHDSGTTYLQDTSGTNQVHTFDFQSCATLGITGAIAAVKNVAFFAESSSTTTTVGLRQKQGGTNDDSSTTDAGTTAYLARMALYLDDATGADWTTSLFDSAEFGIVKGTDNSSVRCTAVYAMVLFSPAPELTLSAAAGVATAALTLSTIASLVLGQVDGLSTAAAPVISRVLMAMQSDGVASAAGTVSTTGYIVPSQADGVAVAAATVISPALLTLSQVDGIAALDEIVIVTAPGDLGSLFADGIAAAAATVSTQALLALSQSDGVALPTLVVSTAGYLVLGQADGLSAPTLALQSPTELVLSATDGIASALATVSTTGFLVLGQTDGIASPTMALQAPALLALSQSDGVALPTATLSSPALLELSQADGVGEATISIYAPAYLTLSQAAGLSNATLAVRSPALLALLSSGVATAAATVISPALLSLLSAGVATATAAVGASPYFLIHADGVATAVITEITFGPHTKVRIPGGIVVRAVIAGGVTPRAGIGGGVTPRVITAGGIPVLVRVGGGMAPRIRIGSGY